MINTTNLQTCMKLALMADEKTRTSRRLASSRACPDEMCLLELGTNGALPTTMQTMSSSGYDDRGSHEYSGRDFSGGGQARHPAAKASSMAMRCLGQSLGQRSWSESRMGCQFFCIRRRRIGQSPSCKAIRPFHPSIHPSQSAAFAIRRLRDDIVSMTVPLPVCARAHLCACSAESDACALCLDLLLLWLSVAILLSPCTIRHLTVLSSVAVVWRHKYV